MLARLILSSAMCVLAAGMTTGCDELSAATQMAADPAGFSSGGYSDWGAGGSGYGQGGYGSYAGGQDESSITTDMLMNEAYLSATATSFSDRTHTWP